MIKKTGKLKGLSKANFISLLEELKIDGNTINDFKSLPNEMGGYGEKYEFSADVVVFDIGDGFCNYEANYFNDNKPLLKKRIFTDIDELKKHINDEIIECIKS